MNIALYIRLSKEDEANNESKSITNQKMYLRNYIKKFKYDNIYEYIDDGYSGTNFNRPAFNKLLEDVENQKINTIITKDSSRLGRNITWVTYYLEEYFPSKKVRYISIDDNYDSKDIDSTESEMLIFKNLFNDYYCKDISRKIKSSLKIKKIEGKFTGWKAPYGYKRKKDDYHKLEIDQNVYEIVKEIFNLAYQDNTPSTIAKILNEKKIDSPSKYIKKRNSKWTTKTIKDILQNPTYIGNIAQGKRKKINYKLKQCINIPKEEWIIKENMHTPIIEKNIYEEIQKKLIKCHNNKNNKIKEKDLINLIYCKECNSKIGLNKKKIHSYCVCNNYKKNYKEQRCTPHTINYDKLKEQIKIELDKEIEKELNLRQLIENKSNLEKKIISKIDKHNEKESNEIKKLNIALRKMINQIKENIIKKQNISKLKDKKELYINMIDKIYLSENGLVEIYLTYKNNH